MIAQLTLLVDRRRHSSRHSDRPMDAIGRPKEAQWSPQLSFNGHYLSAKGGTVVATVIIQWTLLVGQRRHSGHNSDRSMDAIGRLKEAK